MSDDKSNPYGDDPYGNKRSFQQHEQERLSRHTVEGGREVVVEVQFGYARGDNRSAFTIKMGD